MYRSGPVRSVCKDRSHRSLKLVLLFFSKILLSLRKPPKPSFPPRSKTLDPILCQKMMFLPTRPDRSSVRSGSQRNMSSCKILVVMADWNVAADTPHNIITIFKDTRVLGCSLSCSNLRTIMIRRRLFFALVSFFLAEDSVPFFLPMETKSEKEKNCPPHKHHSHACTRNKGVGREGNGEGAKGTGKGKGGGGTVTLRWREETYRTTQHQKQ